MSFSEKNDRYRQIFNSLKNQSKFCYTNKQIADWTGFDPSKVSRFLTGKRDLTAGEFFYLLESMPEEFQQEFWTRSNLTRSEITDLRAAIEEMDLAALGNLLLLIGVELARRNNI